MKSVAAIFAFLLLTSCASYYKEASTQEPHAVLAFEKEGDGLDAALGVLAVTPLEINGKAPNDWSKWDFRKFRVHPGELLVFVRARVSRNVAGIGYLKFVAQKGETYTVARELFEQEVRIYAYDSTGEMVSEIMVPKSYIESATMVPIMVPSS